MHILKSTAAIWLVLSAGIASSSPRAAEAPQEDPMPIATIDSFKLYLSEIALINFRSRNANWKCFSAEIYSDDGGGVRVFFYPKDNVVGRENDILVNASKCGRGITYVVSSSRKITRIILSR